MKSSTRRVRWTADTEQFVRDWYPHVPTATLADALGCQVRRVWHKASELGLRKDRALIAEIARANIMHPGHGGRRTQFRPGAPPWNKGTSYQPGGRSVDTRFATGGPACTRWNYLPIGAVRVTADGTLERKVTDDRSIAPSRRWVSVARLVWEDVHGPIPAGHSVVFRPGRRTIDVEQITPDALELLTRAELMARNSLHRYPTEIVQLMQLRGTLNRMIHDRVRKESKA